MAVFALNDVNTSVVTALGVQPVCLGYAGAKVGIGEHLAFTVKGDEKDSVHW
ncbi:hypothetical protein ACOQNP_23995 [Ectopseudomonas khazarica]|uniref:hypothetical protein n=1 Tax=Ectopseudomonas khazarica TaxID=2502979 RepID=UPI003B94BD89